MAKNYDTTASKYAQLCTKLRNSISRKLIKRESQSLLRVGAISLCVRLTQNNAYNAIDISSIYDPQEEHSIVSWIPCLNYFTWC